MHQKQNISKQYRILTCGNPLGDFYTTSKALLQDLASVNAQVLDTMERPNGSQTECCIWDSGWSYRGKWLLSLPGDNPIFCKNEGCRRIGSSDEALQLNKERVPLLHSVTGEYHIANQAWGIKSKTVQPSEFWLGLRICTNVSPWLPRLIIPFSSPSCRHPCPSILIQQPSFRSFCSLWKWMASALQLPLFLTSSVFLVSLWYLELFHQMALSISHELP